MPESNTSQIKDQQLNQFWDHFFRDEFKNSHSFLDQLFIEYQDGDALNLLNELRAKVFLKQGLFSKAKEACDQINSYSAFKLFVEFLTTGDPSELITIAKGDPDSLVYKAQTIYISSIYWGKQYLDAIPCDLDPDLLVEEAFRHHLSNKNYDKAILTSVQAFELLLEDQILSKDIQLPVLEEHINNLLVLSDKAKHASTKAKVFLIKAKIFKDREAAEDAEIIFGKEGNLYGLGEVYMTYAKEFDQEEYYEKALEAFMKTECFISQGYIFESLASKALLNGEIKEAKKAFAKAKEILDAGGIFEHYGLEIQRISLMAIEGRYQRVKEAVHEMIKPQIPAFFIGQAYQVLSNTIIQLGEDVDLASGYIEIACDIFRQLKRYSQLLYSQNIYFQILLLQNKFDEINKVGQEIITLANKLGNEEMKATKYLDLAFVTVRLSIEDGSFNSEKLETATDYFKKAISLYKDQGNTVGEADTYQAMANMFTGIGQLEEALNAFLTAKKLYTGEKAYLQAAITDTLIGILMLNYVVLNEQTYPLAQRHFEQALVYFNSENLLDLNWKATYYIADLNYKYFMIQKGKEDSELYKNKAKTYYLDLLLAVENFEEESPNISSSDQNIVGISIDEAFNKAAQFFRSIDEGDNAKKFKRNSN